MATCVSVPWPSAAAGDAPHHMFAPAPWAPTTARAPNSLRYPGADLLSVWPLSNEKQSDSWAPTTAATIAARLVSAEAKPDAARAARAHANLGPNMGPYEAAAFESDIPRHQVDTLTCEREFVIPPPQADTAFEAAADVVAEQKLDVPLPGLFDSSRPPIALPKPRSLSSSYTMSTNPPNVSASFRAGDWLCGCGEHNFGRNSSCRTCTVPRSAPPTMYASPHVPSPRFQNPPSSAGMPRFLDSFAQLSVHGSGSSSCSTSGAPSPMFPLTPEHIHAHVPPPTGSPFKPTMAPRHQALPSHLPPRPPMPQRHATEPMQRSSQQPLATVVQQHILTPSGRAFSEGGRVQNVSADPLCPLVIFWPDNEPLPELGQLRPSSSAGIVHPPILNTGNRGPIEHQPGDWVCKKCNYLNWRRRKVCQTCFPYAEGNGDSISATVQASRIAILKQLLDQQTAAAQTRSPAARHPVIGEQHRRQTMDSFRPAPRHEQNYRRPAHLDSSAFGLGLSLEESAPIYQTSPNRQESFPPAMFHQRAPRPPYGIDAFRQSAPPSPYYSPSPLPLGRSLLDDAPYAPQYSPGLYNTFDAAHAPAPAPASSALLPSFLNDLVQSPSLSPASSAESSLEGEVEPSPATSYASLGQQTYQPSPKPTALTGVPVARKSPTANIWRVDGVEAKSRALGPIGSGRKNSWDA
ncbi:hypothetical protein PENSPDRAFT_757885 [Peniophora sp. CONT]|nr:hypothetical protein PENSPDRAFT_757885 [Peniophora sp. CONT]